ncbi:alpha-N-arabinofuranosidase [Prevotella sp. MA2016]|uniref:alpha-N-arabinofuranosidase n=1 Tax=Prevotella sp. MA2016 TaxID=1408310 RepID=UPI00048C2AF1|nr:alpha-L-arabinofuranosidase C-terminal domain-containing protein [Prevotella sp. MA2016]
MKKFIFTATIAMAFATSATAAENVKATVHADQAGAKINKEIYGQFSEHLGCCIYGGLWVGENSQIPNINGYRKDVFEALKALQIPVLRWPGGCFADDYHWMDGIGPKEQRPSLRNNNWGGTIEDNSFGTHEFLNLCEMLGCEPYISGNVGSGTVKEMAQWVEYMTSDGDTPMARLRRQNGRDKAWKVKYFGIGNEAWGCGGNMSPEYYSDEFRKFNTYLRDQGANRLYRIASGASDYDYNWTKVCMDKIGGRMQGISLHYYTCTGWTGPKGSALNFDTDQYYWALGKCLEIEEVIKKHKAIMDEKDPKNSIGLLVDEWGTWWDEEPGTIPGHLYQQNALRDAFVAALSLNVFHKYTDRVKMANIAQVVNVLQSMILTDQEGTGHMVLTPTYHVFQMYTPFQEATYLPVDLQSETIQCSTEYWKEKQKTSDNTTRPCPVLSASAAKTKDGSIVLAITNVSLDKDQTVDFNFAGFNAKQVSGRILTSKNVADFNDFNHPNVVAPKEYKDAKIKKGVLTMKVPAKSIVVVTLK